MSQTIINERKRTCAHWLVCTCSLFKPHAWKYSHSSLCLLLPHSSSVSKIGKSATSSADGDNKLVEEPITSRWQAGGSGLSTCHYLHIDISRSPDRPFLRLPRRATMINPGKRKEGRKKQKKSHSESVFLHAHNVEACRCTHTWTKKEPVKSWSYTHLHIYILALISFHPHRGPQRLFPSHVKW